MTSVLAAFIATALTTLGTNVETDANASALRYSVQFDEATGSASLQCNGSSSGNCTFWFGDGSIERHAAGGRGTLPVGSAPAIVRVVAARPAYCAGLSEQAPPKWPDCTYGPLGGALDRSTTIDYRWK